MYIPRKGFGRMTLVLACALASAFTASAAQERFTPEVIGPAPAFVHTERSTRCSEHWNRTLAYPVFGIPFLDAAVAKEVERYSNGTSEPEGAEAEPAMFESVLGYGLSAPREGLVSILFEFRNFAGGMPYSTGTVWACTYDLRAERQLTPHDLFPDWEASEERLKALLEEAARENCEDPDFTLSGEPSLDGIRKERTSFALDPDGLLFVNSGLPVDMWGMLSFILVEREKLEEAGLNTAWWKEPAGKEPRDGPSPQDDPKP